MPNETWKAKKDRARREIWPSGEPRNLVSVHNTHFLEAIVDIAKWVPCVRAKNTDVRKACSTYLQCGLTVTGMPVGQIRRVYTIANNEWCFPAGTMITTDRGEIPIEQVTMHDRVKTRYGIRKVLWSGRTSRSAELMRIHLEDGTHLDATPNHKVWTQESGWIRVDLLGSQHTLLSCHPNRLFSKGSLTDGIRSPLRSAALDVDIFTKQPLQRTGECCIGKSGSIILEKYQKATTSTTKTGTLSIIPSTISSALRQQTISECTQKQGRLLSLPAISVPSNLERSTGIRSSAQTRACKSTIEIQENTTSRLSASNVALSIRPTNSDQEDFVPVRVLTVTPQPAAEVYDLTIEEDHEFFANGLLVHNCDRVYYRPVSYQEILCWSSDLMTIFTNPANDGMPALQEGYKYPEATTDSTYGRARVGAFAIHNDRLYIAPWLQSNESIVIEWDGYKTDWQDDDVMDTDVWAVDYDAAIKLYVRYCHERDYGVDANRVRICKADWEEKRADLVYQCQERTRQPDITECANLRCPTSEEIEDDAAPTADETITFANIGDYGNPNNGTAEADVAAIVNASGVDFVTTNGDNSYTADFDEDVGQFYHQWIFPYTGAYGAGAKANLFWPVPSNHDYAADDGGGGHAGTLWSYKHFFSGLPGNKRYYDFARGPVHFFMVNSDVLEPDGRAVDSTQAKWLKAKMALSPSRWKIVILQDPPYRSSQDHVPPLGTEFGNTILRWPFDDWGADLVISGDSHYYERLSVEGLTYIVNGAGGTTLGNNFADPPNEYSVFRYPDDNGALFFTVDCDSIKGRFVNTAEDEIDSFEITK